MRFQALTISNLRAVQEFRLESLRDFIVVAGPNGCGKSCVFDGIRLLKSVYGGYSADEHMQWFGELGINPGDRAALRSMFRDPARPVTIQGVIEFAESEKQFLLERSRDLIWPIAWQRVTGQRIDHWTFNRMAIATQLDQYRDQVEEQIVAIGEGLALALQDPHHELAVQISPDGNIQTARCYPAEVSFQAFEPRHLGIIEYHSASRAYTRQPIQGINLDARAFEEQRRQQTLYNAQAKYQNVKTELAAGYLRNLIARASGSEEAQEDLNETLKELFRTFFPDKEYLGVRPEPGGSLAFPVRLPGGETHDIDELSSGEKEILYGYLRLRNSTPRNSVILLDEPELHLNPGLLQGFADFYHRHLGLAQENQLWLVTHSDTLLRQAVGNSNYGVYHMVPGASDVENQATEVLLDDDVERVVVDLVGDLAAYRPHAKVVILEGSGPEAFDEQLVRRLFPDFAKRVNLISAGPKRRVRDLYEALNDAAETAGIANRFFAITDRDADSYADPEPGATEFSWDAYHIENYLLHPAAIREAVASLTGSDPFENDDAVLSALAAQAGALVDPLTLERVQAEVNDELVRAISIGGDSGSDDVAQGLLPSITGSMERLAAQGESLTLVNLSERADNARVTFREALSTNEWISLFPGRRLLKGFAGAHLGGIAYETFRNVIVDKIAQSEYRPEAMRRVFHAIIEADRPSGTSS